MTARTAAKFESCVWSTAIVLEDTQPENRPVPEQCPFFAIRLAILGVTSLFFVLGLTVFANIFFFERRSGYTSVAQRHGINTYLLALILVLGPFVILLVQVLHWSSDGQKPEPPRKRKTQTDLRPASFPRPEVTSLGTTVDD